MQNDYANSLLKIANQLKHSKKDVEPIVEDETTKPIEPIEPKDDNETSTCNPFEVDEDFDSNLLPNPTKDEIIKLLKRKYVTNLKTLRPFVDVMKYKTSSKGVSICPLSSNSKFFNLIYGNQRKVSRVLKTSQEIGLLYCTNENYQYRGYDQVFNFPKQYAYDKRVEKKLLELFEEYGISRINQSYNSSSMISIVDTFKAKAMKDKDQYQRYLEYMKNHRIRITQQTKLALDEKFLILGLNEMYPQYLEMLKTIDEDNRSMNRLDEYDYAYPPTFTEDKDGNVTRIGIRKTNKYCNLKVRGYEDKRSWEGLGEKKSKGRIRDYVISNRLGGIYENDVKSSIYRITYLLNKGVWLDRKIDLYPKMANFEFANQDERNLYKSPLAMVLYFSPSIDKMISNSTFKHSDTKELFKYMDAHSVFREAKRNMYNAIGDSYRSEIFLHESCIYTQVAHRIRSMGYELIQIYDGFFTNRPLDENAFDKIVKECAMEYYEKYKGHWYKWDFDYECLSDEEVISNILDM